MTRAWMWLAIFAGLAVAQEAVSPPILQWAAGHGDGFSRLSNPATASWALSELGTLMCEHDRSTASGLFRQSIAGLNAIPAGIFADINVPVMPVASFTGLWKQVAANSTKCEPALASAINIRQYEERMAEERRQANPYISSARQRIEADPDRAAQLVQAAIEVASFAKDPSLLDFALLGKTLSELRERAPELGDDLFTMAVELVASAPAPSSALFNELGKYLFVNTSLWFRPDEEYLFASSVAGSSEIVGFAAFRRCTDPQTVEAYVAGALRVFASNGRGYDAAIADSVLTQLLPKARALELDSLKDLEKLRASVPANAQVQSIVGNQEKFPETPEIRRARAVRRVLATIRGRRFAEARPLLTQVDDQDNRRQLTELLEFAEASAAIANRDVNQALQIANRTRAGVKRALLYTGVIAVAPREVAVQQAALISRDAADVPAEFRTLILSAAAAVLGEADPDRAVSLLSDAAVALNAARVRPRTARFDPGQRRSVFNQGTSTSTDVPFIRYRETQLMEVLDSGSNTRRASDQPVRHSFEIAVPGVGAYTLPAAIRALRAVDYRRLEAIALDLRDERRRAQALLAIIAVRLSAEG